MIYGYAKVSTTTERASPFIPILQISICNRAAKLSAPHSEMPYLLDKIMANETDLHILKHTTDTPGYTDLLFAFFDYVDKSFAPRLRDIKNQKLCKVKLTGSNGTS